MRAVVREALDKIDTIVSELQFIDKLAVVNLLSALRGPDNEDNTLKHRTTAIIRVQALPKTYSPRTPEKTHNDIGYDINTEDTEVQASHLGLLPWTHFLHHIDLARTALIDKD